MSDQIADLPPLPPKASLTLMALRYLLAALFPALAVFHLYGGTAEQYSAAVNAIVGVIAAAVPLGMIVWAGIRQLHQELAGRKAVTVAASVAAMAANIPSVSPAQAAARGATAAGAAPETITAASNAAVTGAAVHDMTIASGASPAQARVIATNATVEAAAA